LNRPLAFLVTCTFCLTPANALADVVGDTTVKPLPAAPTALPEDEPKLTVIPVPLPLLMVGVVGSYENFTLGPTRNDFKMLGGYIWSRDPLFDPATAVAQPPPGQLMSNSPSDVWRLSGTWDVRLGNGWTLGPAAEFNAGGLTDTGSYDVSLTGGYSVIAGPALHYRGLDERAWPTSGTLADVVYSYGHYVGPETLDFQKGGVNVEHFFPIARNQTIAIRGTVLAGTPKLPWLNKLEAGGGSFVRGYSWNRFTGDRLAAAGLEYRNLVIEDSLAMVGWQHAPVAVGLAGTLHLDAGRAWEARPGVGLAVGSDPRVGGGIGLIVTIDRAPLGRVELNVGSEGLVSPVAQLGTSF
jgi:hypothetical protein